MKPQRTLALVALGSLLVAATPARADEVEDLINKADMVFRGTTSAAVLAMEIKTSSFQRFYKIVSWDDSRTKEDRALIKILGPALWRGFGTLKLDDQLKLYDPKTNHVTVVSHSMLGDAWMGSHFTNDDLVKDSRMIRDYDITIAFEGERDGAKIWEFQLLPHPDAAVVWGKILLEVRQSDLMPLRQRYYDEDGTLARTLTFSNFRDMGGRLVPAEMEMRPADHPQEFTRVVYEDLRFDVPLDDSFFSLRRLRNLSDEQQ